jgi:very-short-patch-repair endonuclease
VAKESKLEKWIAKALRASIFKHQIIYSQVKWPDVFEHISLTVEERMYSVDFWLPAASLIIECHGEQHFTVVDFSGHRPKLAKHNFARQRMRDKKLIGRANQAGIILLQIAHEVIKKDLDYSIDIINNVISSPEHNNWGIYR